MENNLFDGAKFGDRFKTRNGNLAVYISEHGCTNTHSVISAVFDNGYTVSADGRYLCWQESEHDIVGRWQEPIDEDELNRLAQESYPSDYSSSLNNKL